MLKFAGSDQNVSRPQLDLRRTRPGNMSSSGQLRKGAELTAYVMYLKYTDKSPPRFVLSPAESADEMVFAFSLFWRARYTVFMTANTTIADDSPIRMDVAFRYRGASVVGNNQLKISSASLWRKAAHVERIPPELVETKPRAMPVARL